MAFHTFFGTTLCFLSLFFYVPFVVGHGRLIHPPSRATMWRLGFAYNQRDYNDNEGFCGGRSALHNTFKSKCGVCGDSWLPVPRPHERGGSFYTGEVTAYFKAGSEITAEVEITANHKGFFEFRVCPYDKPETGDLELNGNGTMIEVSQSCLDKHILQLANGQGTKYVVTSKSGMGFFKIDLILPKDLHCKNCLFQWRYKTGNSWGTDPNGKSCIGCGKQEEFKACADVVIEPSDSEILPTVRPIELTEGFDKAFENENHWMETTDKPVTKLNQWDYDTETEWTSQEKGQTETTEVETSTSRQGCRPNPIYARVPGMTKWCNINCARDFCPSSHCLCDTVQPN